MQNRMCWRNQVQPLGPPPAAACLPACPPCPAVDYVAMTPEGRVFDSSLEKGYPYQIRVGAGQVRLLAGGALQLLRVLLR